MNECASCGATRFSWDGGRHFCPSPFEPVAHPGDSTVFWGVHYGVSGEWVNARAEEVR